MAATVPASAKLATTVLLALAALFLLPSAAGAFQASEAAAEGIGDETQFVLNTFSLLIWGALVMWMCAGFTMLEAGSVRSKNASMICLKNVGLYSVAGLMFFVIGFNLMYGDVEGGFLGTFRLLVGPSDAEVSIMSGGTGAIGDLLSTGRSEPAFWFFQMVFVATAASIVSGAIAERIKLWVFLAFIAVLTAFIYPIVGAWTWGGGWLAERGFQDFSGSTVVHSTGGWAALAGLLVIGPRLGKFRADGTVKTTPPSNVLLVTLGVLILWFGWFGFNGGSQLALASAKDAVSMSMILVNTNLAGASGFVMTLLVVRRFCGRLDLAVCLNGALAGLVAITAGPDLVEFWWSVIIGAVGGLLATASTRALERYRVDDVVGAVPVHLVAGIWGTLAASIAAGADLGTQLVGVLSIGAFVFGASLLLWKVLDLVVGVRVDSDVERVGQDVGELGIESQPEFMLMPDDVGDM
ncbi:ammonium transporter [Candidatus Poriferisodalis sp.]|uniref:ammonium transporter n=1 Tax=Candidatus Poriferisodalis sp. TaxID=3101277 RepID=UPI003AF79C37